MSAVSSTISAPTPSPFPRSANSDTSIPIIPPPPAEQNGTKWNSPKPSESPQRKQKPEVKEKPEAQPVPPSPDAFILTPLHERVILLILRGHSDSSITKSLNIGRTTLHRWKTCNPVFQAQLNRARLEMWQTNLEHLRGLVSRSLRILEKSMRSKDPSLRLRAATAMLSHAAPSDVAPPFQPIDPDAILDQQVRYFRTRFNRNADPTDPITDKERIQTIQKLQSLLTVPDDAPPSAPPCSTGVSPVNLPIPQLSPPQPGTPPQTSMPSPQTASA